MADLNDQQRAAAESGEGPILIVAGPGTGKTKTLTARIAHLLRTGVDPKRLLALTFTVKAAKEMQGRVGVLLGEAAAPHISTIHALGYRLLQEALPEQELVFVSDTERLAIIRGLPRPQELSGLTVRELGLAISNAKGALDPDRAAPLWKLVERYQQALQGAKRIDFEDLLYKAYDLLLADSALRDSWQGRYDYVLIDEFQDTSELQWACIRLLLGNDNVFVIGDPKQSIYGFRGVSSDMFSVFRQAFPDCTEITLDTNYRSARTIVALASAIFPGKNALQAYSNEQGAVRAIETLNEYSEADLVLELIEKGIGGSDFLKASADTAQRRFRDFAVLYRTHRVARTLQQRLHDSGIPFQVVGEGSPYEQPEVRFVIDVLCRLERGTALPEYKGFSPTQVTALLETLDRELPVSKLADQVVNVFGLQGDSARQQRLKQLIGTLVRFDNAGLGACVEYFDQMAKGDFYDPQADVVTLLTIHASKGLEFTHVIVIGAEEGVLPHIRKTLPTDFDEERRLFYVAATRAKQQLDIIYARKRAGEPHQASRYILELAPEVLPREQDPNMTRLEQKFKRREQKRRQTTLF